jgi:hypothetical protein
LWKPNDLPTLWSSICTTVVCLPLPFTETELSESESKVGCFVGFVFPVFDFVLAALHSFKTHKTPILVATGDLKKEEARFMFVCFVRLFWCM